MIITSFSTKLKIKLLGPVRSHGRKELKNKVFPIPSLTMPTLAALTPSNHEISLHDIYDIVDNEKIIAPEILEDADLVGVSVLTPQIYDANAISEFCESLGIYSVHGGPHITAAPQDSKANTVFVGEAEKTWPLFLEELSKGNPKQKYTSNNKREKNINLVSPRRDLQPKYGLGKIIDFTASVEDSRGCPYACDYCAVDLNGKGYGNRAIDEIINEIESISQKNIFFIGNNFTGNPQYLEALLQRLIPLNKRWIAGATPESIVMNTDLIDSMAKAGARGLFLGFESLSNDYLKSLKNPRKKLDSYEMAISILQDRGIAPEAGFIFGTDYDNYSCFDNVLEFIHKTHTPLVSTNLLTPLPGTKLFEQLEKENRIFDKDYRHYNFDTVVFMPKKMSPNQLQEGYNYFYEQMNSITNTAQRLWTKSTLRYPWIIAPNMINLINHGKRREGNYKI